MARSCESKFIETSAGIEHNVDELLVGVLKQCRLRIELETMSISAKNKKSNETEENGPEEPPTTTSKSRLSSPLRTLQVARDILARACFSNTKGRPMDCENLHIL